MDFLLTGLGNIGRNLLAMLDAKASVLRTTFGLDLRCVGVADSSGCAYDPQGFDLLALVALKQHGGKLSALPAFRPDWSPVDLAAYAAYDVLLEATPTELNHGQPGLDIVRYALQRGKHAVLASKGPLVLAYQELAALSDLQHVGSPALRFSGAVGGGLPSINIGWRDLAGATIERVEMVVNGTTQLILEEMASGKSFEIALAEAQRQGIVEPDPALDVDGWDAASKLVILANAVLRRPTTLAELSVTGIRAVHAAELAAAWSAGGRISLVGLAERRVYGDYTLSVAPTVLAADHPLAHLRKGEMGIVYWSDIVGRTTAASLEDGPIGSCAAMVRDVIEITRR
ncbi:homoserine dehydrogenase [Candidatus Gracilibacteria bacterium]|nr:homoserine dehydrogenase [Candidatus Gracilibacteria bacterium]